MFVLCTCPLCGDVRLPAAQVELTEVHSLASASHYRFTCPDCGETVRKPAEQWVLDALARVPVQRTVVSAPAEVLERAGRTTAAAPLDEDDLIALGTALRDGDDFLAALALAEGPLPSPGARPDAPDDDDRRGFWARLLGF